MKKTVKILSLLLALALSVTMLAGCDSGSKDKQQAASLPEVPEAIEDMRDDAMALTQQFAQDNEGQWVDRVANLVSLNPNSMEDTNVEYAALCDTMKQFKGSTDIKDIFIFIKNEEGTYKKAVSTEKKAKWLEEVTLSDEIKDCLEGQLITSAKSGFDNKWPIYAPMYNSAGEVAAYVCVLYEFDLTDYPEWDRDNEKWHGIE